MAWAIRQQEITEPAARHVLLCLANYASADGRNCFPSVATLSRDSGLSERTIRYKLDALLEAGLITLGNQAVVAAEYTRADRRPVNYNLNLERGASAAPREERGAPAAGRGRERGATDDATGCKPRQNGVHQLHPNRSLTINDPSATAGDTQPKRKATPSARAGEHLQSIGELLGVAVK